MVGPGPVMHSSGAVVSATAGGSASGGGGGSSLNLRAKNPSKSIKKRMAAKNILGTDSKYVTAMICTRIYGIT